MNRIFTRERASTIPAQKGNVDNSWDSAYWWFLSRISSLSAPCFADRIKLRRIFPLNTDHFHTSLFLLLFSRALIPRWIDSLNELAWRPTDFPSFFSPESSFFSAPGSRQICRSFSAQPRCIVKSDTRSAERAREKKTDTEKFSTLQVVFPQLVSLFLSSFRLLFFPHTHLLSAVLYIYALFSSS